MTISLEREAQILRYYHAEHWRMGTIAAQLGIHRSVVARVIAQAGLPRAGVLRRASRIDPYLPFINHTLEQFPALTARRLYEMVRSRGYEGGPDHFRHLIALHRPRPRAEAYLRLTTLPGEQAQVDWAAFGHLEVRRARRTLVAFVMVLSWSREVFLRFYLDARMENFLRGHAAAFAAWGGCPRVLLYDNLKSAVLERHGEAIRFNPALLAFAGHHRFEPRPVAPFRGNEKGRVERAIRYIRTAFFAARRFTDLDDLNAQAAQWMAGEARARRHPEDSALCVGAAFAQEQPRLLPLPDTPFPTDERVAVSVGKTPYVRFDLNDYSVPHDQVRRTLTVLASPTQVRITDGAQVLAEHARSYGRGETLEAPAHVAALVAHKRAAAAARDTDVLTRAVPASRALLAAAAERGEPIGRVLRTLLGYLERYGAGELQAAVTEALDRGVPHPNAVHLALERRREHHRRPPPVDVALPAHVQARDVTVEPQRLDAYDELTEVRDDHAR